MFVDSHCHLDFPELASRIDDVLTLMKSNDVTHALCVSVNLEDFPRVLKLAVEHKNLYASAGVHPDYQEVREPSIEDLVKLATHTRVVAIGETGLDYYRLEGDLEWQRERFRVHIAAAKVCHKPLIIHTRSASEDTLRIMAEMDAGVAGGVMHCFTESREVAGAALDLGFHISFSGIVTFKNAAMLKEVAKFVPLDRMLIETDSPYLAPVPFRGKINEPGRVKHVAEEIARLHGLPLEVVASKTSNNFFNLFNVLRDI
jgi:TatD DNase family protein